MLSVHCSHHPTLPHAPLIISPIQLSRLLSSSENWQYNSFDLETETSGRPLSSMAFFLMKKMDLVKKFHLDETKLARCEQ